MRTVLLLLVCYLPACAYREGATYAGGAVESRWRHATFGTDIEGEEVSASGMKLARQNQSTTAVPFIRTAGTVATADILAGVQTNAQDNSTREVLGAQRAGVQSDRTRAATEQLRIRENTKIRTFVP